MSAEVAQILAACEYGLIPWALIPAQNQRKFVYYAEASDDAELERWMLQTLRRRLREARSA